MRAWLAPVALATATLLLVACRSDTPVLYDVQIDPADITPNQDGDRDVARIGYAVGTTSDVTVTLTSSAGTYALRSGKLRSPDHYEALFGGVIDGRMIPDGSYTVRFEAVPRDGAAPVIVERSLGVAEGDTEAPDLASFAVAPDVLTPNQDGIGDEVTLTYRLDHPADVRIVLQTEGGAYVADLLEEEDSATLAGEPGPHQYRYDAGVEADARPPPDGAYRVVAEARDAAGNVARESRPLEIRQGGQPRAALFGDINWSATTVPLGDTLVFTTTVRNVGNMPIRTRGPEPGYVYDNTWSFNRAAPPGFVLHVATDRGTAATWVPPEGTRDARIDLRGADVDLARHLGGAAADITVDVPLDAPVDTAEGTAAVCGTVVDGGSPIPAVVTALEPDGDGMAQVKTGSDGRFCFDDLAVPPIHERTFARSPGAIRVGFDHDESRRDLAYPYRWQLGRTADLDVCESAGRLFLCLRPGREVTVTGGVRFTEPPFRRLANAYLALMHEDVRQMHGPYDPEAITFEY